MVITSGKTVLESANLNTLNTKQNRDFDAEQRDNERLYHYGFDIDVMHPFMYRSFLPFLRTGPCLELGCHKGQFTKHLLGSFKENQLTCVEASLEALNVAKAEQSNEILFIHETFEKVNLTSTYHNIVMTHVLEHLEDPILVLKRVRKEWLHEEGYFFLVCPNANAPSRQIAVKMGLISHNCSVTPAESKHGHRITYTLDTLERDAKDAGLDIVHRGGIFFKPLANFQWDRLLQTDIISKEYLEGCYQIGQLYPDLCSSIFLVCRR